MRLPSSTLKSFVVLYLSGAVLIYVSLFWQSRRLIEKGFPDFAIWYCAGTVVRQGQAHHFYDHATRFPVEQQFAAAVPQFRGPLPYTHPPFEALFFVPFSYLPFVAAYILWDVTNVGLLAASVFLLRPHLPHLSIALSPLVWIMAALAFFPVAFTLLQGQDAILLLFFYTLAFVNLEKDRVTAAGAWLALGLFKFHLVVPFVLLLLVQKKYRVLYGFLPAAAGLALISVLVVGMKGILAYPRYVLQMENELAATKFVPTGMPSLRGLSSLILGEGKHVPLLLGLMCLGLLVFTAWKYYAAQDEHLSQPKFCLGLLATTLVGYHVVSYDLSILLLCVYVLANFMMAGSKVRPWSSVLIALGWALLFFPPVSVYLSFQRQEFAVMSVPLLACWWGIAREVSTRSRPDVPRQQVSHSGLQG